LEAPSLPRRLHSLSGIVPVGAFLVLHLATNASARRGAGAYNATAERLQRLPALWALELFVIALPLFFHGIYGLYRTAVAPRGTPGVSAFLRRMAVFQRVTGVPLFAFLFFHLWTTRLVQVREHGSLDLFRLMQALLANPWIRTAYVLGLVCATAHFSVGLWTFADGWGLVCSRPARAAAAAVAGAVFVALTALGLVSLSSFRL
jgi:succinate dehydrogenase / fumarate reductase, cytochrome b subunit